MPQSDKVLARLLEKACRTFNVDNIVISPGSRNAPLIIEFTDNVRYNTYSLVDERSAAFFALGIAQQTKKPVILFCTSGSALLNYYPAVAEAFYSNIPLIIVSADRPKDKIDIADGQTIRQENVFANHSLYNANLVVDNDVLQQNAVLIEKALNVAINKKGPVHINVPFEEPLYSTTDVETVKLPSFNCEQQEINDAQNLSKLVTSWNKAKAKIVLVGVNDFNKDLNNTLAQLADDPSVIVLTESTSNLHCKFFINTIDNLIFSLEDIRLESFKPDLLLTFGGMVVSKRIKQFLRKFSPQKHYHISKYVAPDTYFCLTAQIKTEALTVFKRLLKNTSFVESNYRNLWEQRKIEVAKTHQKFFRDIPYADLSVFNSLIKNLPQHGMLQLANSSVIRYTQLFDLPKGLQVYCNRGTSGIDGSMSTAIGAAVASTQQTTFITGDLSFFYDSNALWNKYIPANFRIILINNGGGGIFRILPGPQTTRALDYFEAPHNLTAKHLCDMYNLDYTISTDKENLEKALNTFFNKSNQPKLLEIKTPRTLNDKVLKDYFKILK
ncbi:MAG: 2-succinyl-5-enolpyruvyl-6-hydroxy-3-cyclohexene-1-carboxylic-acid synthase [Flavobacteriaceae bacterium]